MGEVPLTHWGPVGVGDPKGDAEVEGAKEPAAQAAAQGVALLGQHLHTGVVAPQLVHRLPRGARALERGLVQWVRCRFPLAPTHSCEATATSHRGEAAREGPGYRLRCGATPPPPGGWGAMVWVPGPAEGHELGGADGEHGGEDLGGRVAEAGERHHVGQRRLEGEEQRVGGAGRRRVPSPTPRGILTVADPLLEGTGDCVVTLFHAATHIAPLKELEV